MRYRVWQTILMSLLMTTVSSCTTANFGTPGLSGPGMYNPIIGKYTQEFSVPLDKTWVATLDALKALDLTPVTQAKDQLGGQVLAKRGDGTDVKLILRPDGLFWTRVTIEVGRGEEEASIRIARELERRLKR